MHRNMFLPDIAMSLRGCTSGQANPHTVQALLEHCNTASASELFQAA